MAMADDPSHWEAQETVRNFIDKSLGCSRWPSIRRRRKFSPDKQKRY